MYICIINKSYLFTNETYYILVTNLVTVYFFIFF